MSTPTTRRIARIERARSYIKRGWSKEHIISKFLMEGKARRTAIEYYVSALLLS